jgi:hypothetical protein
MLMRIAIECSDERNGEKTRYEASWDGDETDGRPYSEHLKKLEAECGGEPVRISATLPTKPKPVQLIRVVLFQLNQLLEETNPNIKILREAANKLPQLNWKGCGNGWWCAWASRSVGGEYRAVRHTKATLVYFTTEHVKDGRYRHLGTADTLFEAIAIAEMDNEARAAAQKGAA